MVAIIIVVIVLILSVSQFYLKNAVLTSFSTLISAILALIIAFGYYETINAIVLQRNFGGQWAQASCFILLFVIAFALIRLSADYLVGANIDFGKPVKIAAAIVCGLFTGIIIAGVILNTIAMSPASEKLSYKRFGKIINLANPNKAFLNVDQAVVSLFSWISSGSMSSSKNFNLLHHDFLNQLYINKRFVADDVYMIAAKNCLIIPKDGVKTRKRDDGSSSCLDINLGIKGNEISDGGAKDPHGYISFALAQIRLICAERKDTKNPGKVKTLYPVEYRIPTKMRIYKRADLNEIIKFSPADIKNTKRTAWITLSFDIPDNLKPICIQFKQNALIEIPAKNDTDTAAPENAGSPAKEAG